MSKVIPDCEKRLVGVQSGQVGSGGQEDLWVEMHGEGDSLKTETASKQRQLRFVEKCTRRS